MLNWPSKRTGIRPFKAFSSEDGCNLDACLFSPIGSSHGFAIKCKEHIAAPVSVLLSHGDPSAIRWRIAFRVVDSIYRHILGAFTHIGKEALKLAPSFAQGYASAPVVFIGMVVAVIASFLNALPNMVGTSSAFPVGSGSCTRHFIPQAPTRTSLSGG
jgi:hypothetical protein